MAVNRFYTEGKIGPRRSWTPEGFLICHDVPIARVGTLIYVPGEVPIDAGKDGVIAISREPEDVFDADAIASFEGKPVTNDHPPLGVKVDPTNYRQLNVGDAHNVRRGDGLLLDDNYLFADLLIKDQAAIQDVIDGKKEVSAGYDAEYEQLETGRGRQHEIIGNHVALVDHGRCGPTCSIGDSDTMKSKRGSFADRIRTAFRTRDEDALVEELDKVKDMLGEVVSDDMPAGMDTNSGHAIHLNFNGMGSPSMPKSKGSMSVAEDEDPEVGGPALKEDPTKSAAGGDIGAMIAQIMQRMNTMEQAIMLLAQDENNEEEQEPEDSEVENIPGKVEDDEAEMAEGSQKKWPPANAGSTEDRRRTVGDSSSLASSFQDMVSKAAILCPTQRLPVFDAARGAKMTIDAMCNFRRTTLAKAWATDDGREVISRLHSPRKVDFSRDAMTCDAVTALFNGAAELIKTGNTQDAARGFAAVMDHGREVSSLRSKVPSIADLNKRAADVWGGRNGIAR